MYLHFLQEIIHIVTLQDLTFSVTINHNQFILEQS